MALRSARLWGDHTNELERIKIRRPQLMVAVQAYVHRRRDQEIWHKAFELKWPT